jgi:hypothetical protein
MKTREEAIAVLEESKRQNEIMRDNPTTFWAPYQIADGIKNTERRIDALDAALSALRPVSRERVERDKRRWEIQTDKFPYYYCSGCGQSFEIHSYDKEKYRFCPFCMAPMTDDAVQMAIERLEALNDDSR